MKRKTLYTSILILMVIFGSNGCKNLPVFAPEAELLRGSVTGVVVDEDSIQRGISSAHVMLVYQPSTWNREIAEEYTYWNGEFFFNHLPRGNYSIIVRKDGYMTQIIDNIVVLGNSNTSVGPILLKDVYLDDIVYNHGVRWAGAILGPPDRWESCAYIDTNDTLIVDFGAGEEVANGEGPDLRIFFTYSRGQGVEIYASSSPTGPWTYLGRYNNSYTKDINLGALDTARFIKIVGIGESHIDAMEALNYIVGE